MDTHVQPEAGRSGVEVHQRSYTRAVKQISKRTDLSPQLLLQENMDLLVIQTDHNESLAQKNLCRVHPDTLLDLRVPALSLIAMQDNLLLGGAKTYLRCLPCETTPQGSIRLASCFTDQVSVQGLRRVRVEGINGDQHCELGLLYQCGCGF